MYTILDASLADSAKSRIRALVQSGYTKIDQGSVKSHFKETLRMWGKAFSTDNTSDFDNWVNGLLPNLKQYFTADKVSEVDNFPSYMASLVGIVEKLGEINKGTKERVAQTSMSGPGASLNKKGQRPQYKSKVKKLREHDSSSFFASMTGLRTERGEKITGPKSSFKHAPINPESLSREALTKLADQAGITKQEMLYRLNTQWEEYVDSQSEESPEPLDGPDYAEFNPTKASTPGNSGQKFWVKMDHGTPNHIPTTDNNHLVIQQNTGDFVVKQLNEVLIGPDVKGTSTLDKIQNIYIEALKKGQIRGFRIGSDMQYDGRWLAIHKEFAEKTAPGTIPQPSRRKEKGYYSTNKPSVYGGKTWIPPADPQMVRIRTNEGVYEHNPIEMYLAPSLMDDGLELTDKQRASRTLNRMLNSNEIQAYRISDGYTINTHNIMDSPAVRNETAPGTPSSMFNAFEEHLIQAGVIGVTPQPVATVITPSPLPKEDKAVFIGEPGEFKEESSDYEDHIDMSEDDEEWDEDEDQDEMS